MGLTSWWGMQVRAQTAVLQGYVLGWQRAEVSGSGEGGGHQKVMGNLQGAGGALVSDRKPDMSPGL